MRSARSVQPPATYTGRLPRLLWLLFVVVSLCTQRYDDTRLLIAIAAWVFATKWLYNRLTNAVRNGRPFRAASSVWLASPVPLSIIVVFGEHRPFTSLLDLSKMPLSLIIGDSIVLPTAAAIAAWSVKMSANLENSTLQALKKGDVADSSLTWWICLLLGHVAGVTFHVWDAGNYAAAHLDSLVWSISKMWHDLVAYPSLFGGLLFAFVVIVVKTTQHRGRFAGAFLICILAWLCLGIYDGSRGLDARNFHSPCNLQCGVANMTDDLSALLGHLDGFAHATLEIVRSVFKYFLIM